MSRSAARRPGFADLAWPAEPRPVDDGEPERPTWAYPWPAGERLRGDLAALVDLAGRRVLDLGCGRGRLGCAAWCAGASAVTCADASPSAVAWVAAVARRNRLDGLASVVHRWGEPVPGGPYDLVLGGDILYRPECFADLLASIAGALSASGKALLADPRTRLEPELRDLAERWGLHFASERRPAGYTLVVLRPDRTGGDRADRRR